MVQLKRPLAATLLIAGCALICAGCYEEAPNSPQPQTQAPRPAAPQGGGSTASPMQSSSSALGGAKRAATNIVNQAEEQSQKTADEIDKGNNP